MKNYSVTRPIAAEPAAVWSVITDADKLQSGNTGITRLEGQISLDGRIKLWSAVSPERAFALKVSTLDAPRRMVWTGGMPLGLFRGVRTFTLAPQGDGTQLHIEEVFSGPLSGPICRSMPDLQPSFEQLADGIKALAESAKDRT